MVRSMWGFCAILDWGDQDYSAWKRVTGECPSEKHNVGEEGAMAIPSFQLHKNKGQQMGTAVSNFIKGNAMFVVHVEGTLSG